MVTTYQERLAYSVEEAGALLGWGKEAAKSAANRGTLPTIRIGRKRYVTKTQLDQLLASYSGAQIIDQAANDAV